MKTTLTVEQSADLIKRGVSANKASDTYVGRWEHSSEGSFADPESVEPLFTLADLLSLLPNNYPGNESDDGDKRVYLTIAAVDWNSWMAKYSTINEVIAARIKNEMIDAVYELLLWAIDHNHVKLD